MNAEQWLMRYIKLKRRAFEEQLKIKELRASQVLPAPVNDGMPHGSGQSDLSGYAAKLLEMEEEYTRIWNRAKEVRGDIVAGIVENLPRGKQQRLFINKYIADMGSEENAKELGVSIRHYYRLWKDGLNRLNRAL